MDSGLVSPIWLLSWAASHSSSQALCACISVCVCVHALVCVCVCVCGVCGLHVKAGACLRVKLMYVITFL